MLSHVISAHGGRLELLDLDPAGKVEVKFRGLCTACELRPITLAAIVEPALLALPGVSEVSVSGLNLSTAARDRIASSFRKRTDARVR
jgi:Fe-S cluster biogenesis protein NfuA